MKSKEAVGVGILFLVGLFAAVILTFLFLYVAPTHPGNEQHEEIMNFLMPVVHSNTDFLDENELDHMWDVKALFFGIIILFMIGVFALKKVRFEMRERFAGYGLLLLLAFFSGVALKGFTEAWTNFHKVFFPQGNWIFPYDSILITLYPESYFFGAALILAAFMVVIAGLLIGNFKIPWINK